MRGERAQILSPVQSESSNDGGMSPWVVEGAITKKETAFSINRAWVDSDGETAFSKDLEPDTCLLIIEAKETSVVANRLGVAYIRIMDFSVAGAEVRGGLLGVTLEILRTIEPYTLVDV